MRMKAEKQTKTSDGAAQRRVVLVGTYRGDQLKDWPGWYCWPLGGDVSATKNAKSAKTGRARSPSALERTADYGKRMKETA